jgi:Tfp pilus assembly protein PilO
MNRRGVLIGAGAGLVAVLAWYLMLFAPAKSDVSDTKRKLADAQNAQTVKAHELQSLQALKQQSGTSGDSARRLDQLVPARPELASFIDNANTIATRSGIDFLSISPTPPSATVTVGGASVIAMSMQIEGTFYDLLKYLDSLQDPDQMPRLVVIDSLNVAAKGDSVQFAGQSPTLAVTLSARMFMQPAGATTPSATPGTGTSGTGTPGATTTGGATSPSSGNGTAVVTTPTGSSSNTSNTAPSTQAGTGTSAPSTAIQ